MVTYITINTGKPGVTKYCTNKAKYNHAVHTVLLHYCTVIKKLYILYHTCDASSSRTVFYCGTFCVL